MLMEMVHVMCKYLKVKTKVTANAPARYIWVHYVCVANSLEARSSLLTLINIVFLGLILSWDFVKKCPHTPDPTVTSGRDMV